MIELLAVKDSTLSWWVLSLETAGAKVTLITVDGVKYETLNTRSILLLIEKISTLRLKVLRQLVGGAALR